MSRRDDDVYSLRMLQLRLDQEHVLEQVRKEAARERLRGEFSVFAPGLARVIGPAGERALVDLAAATARDQGFATEAAVRLFLQYMCSFGSDFTCDPQLPWARETLERTRHLPEEARLTLLFRRSSAYLDGVHGEGHEHAIAALRRLLAAGDDLSRYSGDLAEFIALAAHCFPQKYAYVGRACLRELYDVARHTAARYELGSQGPIVLASLAFALGSGIAHDPAYPWIERTLVAPGFGSGARRTARLRHRVTIYAHRVLDHLTAAAHAQE